MATRAALRRVLSAAARAQRGGGAFAAARAHAPPPLFAAAGATPPPPWQLLHEGARCGSDFTQSFGQRTRGFG
jgi:hypothetical protein